MDLYDNLENYNEERIIAELREENKDLKIKLEEYAAALEKLQKEMDRLSIEHKTLESNYSSLLKTARSEIERKTQIISKLNIEKDAMVLNSINRNLPYKRRWNKPTNNQETKPVNSSANRDDKQKPSINKCPNERLSSNSSIENIKTSVDSNPPPLPKFQTRLLNMVNKSNTNPASQNEAKENIQTDTAPKASAQISWRRKSMPAFRLDSPQFSPDEDEEASSTGESCKEFSKEPESQLPNFPHKSNTERRVSNFVESTKDLQTKINKNESDKHRSQEKIDHLKYRRHSPESKNIDSERKYSQDRRRVSPERKRIVTEKPKRSRYSPRRTSPGRRRKSPDRKRGSSDRRRFSPERRKPSPNRRGFSPERRRLSPDRRRLSPNKRRDPEMYKGPRDSDTHSREELYQRHEYEKHRRLVSPIREKQPEYKHYSQETQKSHDVFHHSEQDTYKSHSQDRYPIKHKIPSDYEEPNTKRMRLDSYHRSDDGKNIAEPIYLHDMSCQSPEFSHHDAQTSHQIREIKLNATSELEDPRLSCKRYSINMASGKPVLVSNKNSDVYLKVIDRSSWDIIAMPDALLQNPNSSLLSCDSLQKSTPYVNPQPRLNTSGIIESAGSLDELKSCHDTQAFALPEREIISKLGKQEIPNKPQDKTLHRSLTTDMPDVLQNKSASSINKLHLDDDIVNEIYMDIDNPISNESLKPGEIYDNLEIEQVETTAKLLNIQITRDHVQNNDSQSQMEHVVKDVIIPDKHSSLKVKRKKHHRKSRNDATEKQDNSPPSNITQSNELKTYESTKEIIGDFELSDESSDNTDAQIRKHPEQGKNLVSDGNIAPKEKDIFEPENAPIDKIKITLEKKHSKYKKKSHKTKDAERTLDIESLLPENNSGTIKTKSVVLKADKDTSLSMDVLEKMREDIAKQLENTDPLNTEIKLPKGKSAKKKEPKVNISPKNKEIIAPQSDITVKNEQNKAKEPKLKSSDENKTNLETQIDKSMKNKECSAKDAKIKVSIESKNIIEPRIEKPVKNKEKIKALPECKEIIKQQISKEGGEPQTKITSAKGIFNADQSSKIEKNQKSPELKNPPKQRKKKQNIIENTPVIEGGKAKVTQFNELFGDSSSLVSPEDLGLVSTVIPQDNYGAMFEDAQDATEITSIKPVPIISTDKVYITEDKEKQGININAVTTPVVPYNIIKVNKENIQSDNVTKNMYENLQPELMEKDEDVVKTVIISSGIQPKIVSEVLDPNSDPIQRSDDLYVMQCVKPTIIQGLNLQALATSTPHKMWLPNPIQNELDNIPIQLASSRDTSLDRHQADNPNNTNNSQTKETDEPDVKIFVKRRRKVVKKSKA